MMGSVIVSITSTRNQEGKDFKSSAERLKKRKHKQRITSPAVPLFELKHDKPSGLVFTRPAHDDGIVFGE